VCCLSVHTSRSKVQGNISATPLEVCVLSMTSALMLPAYLQTHLDKLKPFVTEEVSRFPPLLHYSCEGFTCHLFVRGTRAHRHERVGNPDLLTSQARPLLQVIESIEERAKKAPHDYVIPEPITEQPASIRGEMREYQVCKELQRHQKSSWHAHACCSWSRLCQNPTTAAGSRAVAFNLGS
jgi:hypothetical protein